MNFVTSAALKVAKDELNFSHIRLVGQNLVMYADDENEFTELWSTSKLEKFNQHQRKNDGPLFRVPSFRTTIGKVAKTANARTVCRQPQLRLVGYSADNLPKICFCLMGYSAKTRLRIHGRTIIHGQNSAHLWPSLHIPLTDLLMIMS